MCFWMVATVFQQYFNIQFFNTATKFEARYFSLIMGIDLILLLVKN